LGGESWQGFIMACTAESGAESIKICQMPMRVRLDTPWPLQKVPVRADPHRLAFYAEARLYVLLTSRSVRHHRSGMLLAASPVPDSQ
jgi:cleavage and polyadenylation specificity factor subunit 1